MEAIIMLVIHFLWINGVGQNLTASAILGVPAVVQLHRKLTRHHRERMDQAKVHHAEVMAHHEGTRQRLARIHLHQIAQQRGLDFPNDGPV
jgi:hypothetical protein